MSSTDAVAPRRGGVIDGLATVVATGLGSGYSPLAPGTAGSAVGLALYWPMRGLSPLALLAAIVLVSAVGVAAAARVARRAGQEDPGLVVVDEVAGMWVTLWLLPATPLVALVGFVAFRAMDVFKPWPARDLERLPGGWGIMADDLMAGVYANLLVRVLLVSGLISA
jgi:phosphatidylglycerophosphatase A